jgi:hypothetical protein
MSKLLVIVLTLELLIAVFFGQGGFVRRRDFDRAFFAWYQNPTPENKSELDRQRHINDLHRLGFSAVAFGGIAIATLLAAYTYNRALR